MVKLRLGRHALATIATLSSLALASTAFGATGAVERVKKAKVLEIAIDATYPPMESEGADGKPVGFDIDFAKEVAKRLGVEAKFQVMNWDGILAGLASRRYDVIISSMNITDERKKQVDFVEYVKMSQLFVSKKGQIVSSEKDLAGKVVAVQADTTSMEFVENKKKAGVAIKDVKAFKLATDAFAAVKAGQAEVIVIDEPVGKYYAKQDAATFQVTGRAMAPEPVGVAIRKADADLTKAISKIVEDMRKDGTLKKLSEQWFGGELGA
jgi:ABC-type amino acid transport substrate-binding protein